MDDRELLALEREVDELAIYHSPLEFAQVVSRDHTEPWVPYEWLKLVNQKLLALVEGRLGKDRLLLTAPPRHGKSQICSLYLPAWFLNRYPSKRVMLCSYGDDFAAEWGRKVRDLIENQAKHLGISVSKNNSAADRWDLAGESGGMKTAGVGGQITGRGAHLLIMDDPIKDAEDAASLTMREKKWDWWRSTVQTRLEPGAVTVLILTRWHHDDLAGRILEHEKDRWEIINLPALAEDEDAMGRVPGEPLCPERYDEGKLALIRESIGTQAWTSLYQQRPSPEGGGVFKKRDFRYYKRHVEKERTYVLGTDDGNVLVPTDECWRFATVDLAISKGQQADYTVIAIWDVAAWLKPTALILNGLIREHFDGSEHVPELRKVWSAYRPSFIGIESASFGSMTIQAVRREGIIVRELKARSRPRDKEFRARDAALLTENHRLYFPASAPWLHTYEHELLAFPSGTHDDCVDVTGYAAGIIIKDLQLLARPKQPPEPMDTITALAWDALSKKREVYDHPISGRL